MQGIVDEELKSGRSLIIQLKRKLCWPHGGYHHIKDADAYRPYEGVVDEKCGYMTCQISLQPFGLSYGRYANPDLIVALTLRLADHIKIIVTGDMNYGALVYGH
jgi:hypothetical protein